jgi:hypothetical protein
MYFVLEGNTLKLLSRVRMKQKLQSRKYFIRMKRVVINVGELVLREKIKHRLGCKTIGKAQECV